jgi:lysophospholipase
MRRRLLPFLLCLPLLACGQSSDRAPFVDSRAPPSLTPRFYPPEGWAWGLIQAGEAPPQRYGVASPPVASTAQVLILTGYGQPAEAWFETANDLVGVGYTVWILERAGEGGSGRYAGPRDLVHAPSFEDDVAVTRALAVSFIPRDPRQPVIVLGEGVGAVVALQAAEAGMPVDGMVLSSGQFTGPTQGKIAAWTRLFGLTAVRAPAGGGWSRDGVDPYTAALTHDPRRGAVAHAWQLANPDLRMGGPSIGWISAATAASGSAVIGAAQSGAPVLMLSPGDDSRDMQNGRARLCHALPHCTETLVAGARPALYLETDAYRSAWLRAIETFITARTKAIDPLTIGPRRVRLRSVTELSTGDAAR